MTKDVQSITSSIIEISSKDSVSKEIVMLVHKIDIANDNGLDFKLEYTEKFKDSLINKPVVAKYYPIKNDLGDHEPVYDKHGKIIGLETIAIGTIKEVWVDDFTINSEETVKALFAKADLWNYKYPEVVTCIKNLFKDGYADTSVEVEIYKYGENPSPEYRYPTDYTYIGNCILGSTSPPADPDAGVISVAQKEVAMALSKDISKNKLKGDKEMEEKELFNKGFEIKNKIELSELSFDNIRQQLYNHINPVNPQTNERSYKYFIREVFSGYMIIESWDNIETLYKIDYTIDGTTVVVSPNWIPVEVTYQEVGKDMITEINELQSEITKLKEEIKTMSQEKKLSVEELESKVTELNSKIEELNSLLVSEKEAKTSLEGQVTELNTKVEELEPFKVQVEKAEKDAKITELSSKYSKLLSEDTFKSEEVQKAINELNSVELNSIVVNEIAKEKVVETSSKDKKDEVIVVAAKQEDLVEHDKKAYWASKA